jgi:peptidoglycan/LPS O-acetylase OafA/YrhL
VGPFCPTEGLNIRLRAVKPRILELDGIRGLAVLLVILHHCVVSQIDPPAASLLAYARLMLRYCWTGVDLFFVLSGFLIGGILLDNADARNYFRVFYVRRAYRILPLYYLFLSLSALAYLSPLRDVSILTGLFRPNIAPWAFPLHLQNVVMALENGLGGYGLAPTWSLAVEEHFYLVIPLLIRATRRRGPMLGLMVVGAFALRVVLWVWDPRWHVATYVLTFCRADALAIGVLLALVFRRAGSKAWLARNRGFIPFALLAFGAIFLVMLKRGVQLGTMAMALGGHTVFALFYGCLIVGALVHPQIGPIFRMKWLGRLGTLAYCLYLIHLPINALVHAAAHRSTAIVTWMDGLITCLGFVIMLALASLSWRYFEHPMLEVGHRWSYERMDVTVEPFGTSGVAPRLPEPSTSP